ncbi:hypothetical protein FSST1_006301 [Fusarium sambucinum]
MSGAEAAIAGVGFLCSAIQIATFCRDILQGYCQVRDGRSPDPRLEEYLKSTGSCFRQMKTSALATAQAQWLNSDQQQIIEVGRKLQDSIAKLQSKFSDLHIDDASKRGIHGKMRMVTKAIASMWHSKELGSLEDDLKRYERLLHGITLHRVCNQVQAAEIQSNQNFHQLSADLQSFITKLADGCTKVSDLSISSLEIRSRVTQEHEKTRTVIDQGLVSTQGAVSNMHESMSQRFQDSDRHELNKDLKRRHEQLLESLRFSEMNSRKNQVSGNYPGTFSWVFENTSHSSRNHLRGCEEREDMMFDNEETDEDDIHDDVSIDNTSESVSTASSLDPDGFPAWLQSESNLFWISGKPASGKSSLMKFLATNALTREHLKVWQQNMRMTSGNLRIIGHFFWKPGQSLQNNIQGMLLSLLHQVLCKNPHLAQRLWEDQKNVSDKRARGDWNLNELREALYYSINSSGDAFCIFLDGLDEAREMERLPWRDRGNAQVIHDLLRLNNVKICASSREEHPFCLFFEGRSRLRIHLLTYKDIYCFAKQKLEPSGLDSSYRVDILRTLVEKANGVFLWVVLVLDSLNRAIRSGTAGVNEIKERLAQTPSDLHDLFIDMWERPGDDAELSSFRNDSSRYFSLAITANKLQEDVDSAQGGDIVLVRHLNNNGYEPHLIHTLLVMATALEDEPLASILDSGRYMHANDLQARCASVESRLRLVSRGLLEIVTAPNLVSLSMYPENPQLGHYDAKKVEFIHRSAFDFIMDTQIGRECLSACHWSSNEQIHRLLGGHLIRSRFLYVEQHGIPVTTTSKIRYTMLNTYSMELKRALTITYSWRHGNLTFENSMLRTVEDWQKSGLFYSHSYWRHPQANQVPSKHLGLGFLEGIVHEAPRFTIISDLLDKLPIGRLIDAIPAMFREFVRRAPWVMLQPRCPDLIGYILTRLHKASDERRYDVSSQAQADIRDVTLALNSWFLIQCLWALSMLGGPVKFESEWQKILGLLGRFRDTLSSTHDWHHPMVLAFGEDDSKEFSPKGLFTPDITMPHAIVAVLNLVTAYRIVGLLVHDRLSRTLAVQAPEESSERFDIVLINGETNRGRCLHKMFSPASEYHDRIATHVENTLLGVHTKGDSGKRKEAWRVFVESIGDGLTLVSDDVVEYCMDEFARRDLEFIHPWHNKWIREERSEELIVDELEYYVVRSTIPKQ